MSILLYEKSGHILTITLNRPESLNAMSRKLAAELVSSLTDFEDDPNLWVAIITGSLIIAKFAVGYTDVLAP